MTQTLSAQNMGCDIVNFVRHINTHQFHITVSHTHQFEIGYK